MNKTHRQAQKTLAQQQLGPFSCPSDSPMRQSSQKNFLTTSSSASIPRPTKHSGAFDGGSGSNIVIQEHLNSQKPLTSKVSARRLKEMESTIPKSFKWQRGLSNLFVDFTKMEKKPPNLDQLKKMCEDQAADDEAKGRDAKFRNSLKNARRMSQQLKQVSHDISMRMNPSYAAARASLTKEPSKDGADEQNERKGEAQSKEASLLSLTARERRSKKPLRIDYD